MLEIATGISIAIHYNPSGRLVFDLFIELKTPQMRMINKDTCYIYGSSALFLALYLHILKEYYYKSYV